MRRTTSDFRWSRVLASLAGKAFLPSIGVLLLFGFSAAPVAAACLASGKNCVLNAPGNDRKCCPGMVCGAGNVCQPGCRIAGIAYKSGVLNPNNPCQTCRPSSSQTSWTNLAAGSSCGSQSSTQCDNPNTCNGSGQCLANNQPNNTPCNDANLCTQTDTCQGGVCTGANPVPCTALDQCHVVGTCNPATGLCSNPNAPNGTTCETGDFCTADTCVGGTCTAGPLTVVCPDPDQCHDPGTCIPATGLCTDPAKPDNTYCSDGNACTQTDACTAGACVGSDPVDCIPNDQCHERGTCDPETGACTNPAEPDGSFCFDFDACTINQCQSGVCQTTGSAADGTECFAFECKNATCQAGVCQEGSNVADGTECDDNERCLDSTCQAGVCQITSNAPNGTSCFDDNFCKGPDFCVDGACQSGPNANEGDVCDSGPALCTAHTCVSGACLVNPDPAAADGFFCGSDGQACTINDRCQAGVCRGTSRPNGAPCNDGEQCTAGDTCQAGACQGGTSVTEGTACDDGQDVCTSGDSCQAGLCQGTNAADGTNCDDGQDVCTTADVCQAGVCTGASAADGTTCDDGIACNEQDKCQAGVCRGDECHGDVVTCPQPYCSAFTRTDGDGCSCTYAFWCDNQTRCGADGSCPAGTVCSVSCCPENVCNPACE